MEAMNMLSTDTQQCNLSKPSDVTEVEDLYSCKCEDCKRRVYRGLKLYEIIDGWTSPENMASKDNPLQEALELTHKIKNIENREIEMKNELREFTTRCKDFTVGLCDECQDEKEIAALMNFDEETLRTGATLTEKEVKTSQLRTLQDAVDAHHLKFVAHRHSQLVLNTVIYDDMQSTGDKKYFLEGLPFYIFYALLFPIFVLIFVFHREHNIAKRMKTPFAKFVSQVSQFGVFLALLVVSTLRDSHHPSTVEYLIFIYVVAMAFQETREMLAQSSTHGHYRLYNYLSKWWNVVTAVMLIFFLSAGAFWFMGFAVTGDWSTENLMFTNFRERSAHKLLLLGNSCFSVASVLSIFYMGTLCQVNAVFGPLELSVVRMFRDIAKFLTFFLGLFFAFTLGIRNLYSYNQSLQLELIRKRNHTDTMMKDQRLVTFWDAMQTMFWALFDQTNLDDFGTIGEKFEITQETGKFLFAMFSVCAVMVGINMLIAMMNRTFEKNGTDGDDNLNWKFSRTRMWLEYVWRKSYLPPPYNLMQFLSVRKSACTRSTTNNNYEKDIKKEREKEQEREEIVRELARRHIAKRRRKTELKAFEEFCKQRNIPLTMARTVV